MSTKFKELLEKRTKENQSLKRKISKLENQIKINGEMNRKSKILLESQRKTIDELTIQLEKAKSNSQDKENHDSTKIEPDSRNIDKKTGDQANSALTMQERLKLMREQRNREKQERIERERKSVKKILSKKELNSEESGKKEDEEIINPYSAKSHIVKDLKKDETSKEVTQLKKEVAKLNAELKEMKTQNTFIAIERNEFKDRIDSDISKKTIENFDKQNEELNEKKRILEEKLIGAKKQIDEFDLKYNKLEKQMDLERDELKKLKKTINDLNQKLKLAKSKNRELDSKIFEQNAKIIAAEKKIDELSRSEGNSGVKINNGKGNNAGSGLVQNLQDKIIEYKHEVNNLRTDKEKMLGKVSQFDDLSSQLEKLIKKNAELEKKLKNKSQSQEPNFSELIRNLNLKVEKLMKENSNLRNIIENKK